MSARTVAELPAGTRITGYISLGVLARAFAAETLRSALAATQNDSVRQRELPAHAGGAPRAGVPRSVVMNHMIHHHAQFGGYLRLLDVPVPGADGPSTDGTPGFGVWKKSGRPAKTCPSHHFPVFITMSILPLK